MTQSAGTPDAIPTILLVGLGGLGRVTLELLAREPHVGRIVATARDERRGTAACNLATIGAMAQGRSPRVEFAPLDVTDSDAVAEVVRRARPDVIYTSVTLQTWWLPSRLPPPKAVALARAGFGVWLPVHLALTLQLMRALRAANYTGHVITAPFPDVANCVLGRLGLAPTCGVGNLDEIAPKVRLQAAGRLGVDADALRVYLVAHHAFEGEAFREESDPNPAAAPRDVPPFFVRVEHEGRDVTREVDAETRVLDAFPICGGPEMHFLTAGSTVRLLRALLQEQETFLHVPGPHGLPGGYPAFASRAGIRLAPVPGLSHDEAIGINERSHPFDGIERIDPDGTVVFRLESAAVLRETLGYDCVRLAPDEIVDRGHELVSRFREYAKGTG